MVFEVDIEVSLRDAVDGVVVRYAEGQGVQGIFLVVDSADTRRVDGRLDLDVQVCLGRLVVYAADFGLGHVRHWSARLLVHHSATESHCPAPLLDGETLLLEVLGQGHQAQLPVDDAPDVHGFGTILRQSADAVQGFAGSSLDGGVHHGEYVRRSGCVDEVADVPGPYGLPIADEKPASWRPGHRRLRNTIA